MSEDFLSKLKKVRAREQNKQKEYKEASKERLFKICSTKIKTTMIGALDTIEKKFGKYWTPDAGHKMSNEQLLLKKIYDEIRQEILDKGNTQIRNLETEFEQYDIDWKRYTLTLPVKQ